ncbi:MAG: hypothetical protein EB059_10565 [Alphaproteobacteria bacterium]|nr:hypothetical protein [Alphaproteobacteria bacterium]
MKQQRKASILKAALQEICARYSESGMNVIPVGNLGTPEEVRRKLKLKPNDFGVCAFMASSPGKSAFMRQVVRDTAVALGAIDREFTINLPLISGGGNWKGLQPDDTTGYMGQWAYGASQNDRLLRFVITQGLIDKEGLPLKPGYTLCIRQNLEDISDARLGLRTDGLISAGDLLVSFWGGLGTLVEDATVMTNLGIHQPFSKKKLLIIDAVFQNPQTGTASYFFGPTLEQMKLMHAAGLIRDQVVSTLNDHCIVYRPDVTHSPEQVVREIVSVILAIRSAAPDYNPQAEYSPLPRNLLDKYVADPLQGNSSVGRIFEDTPLKDRSWGPRLRFLSTRSALALGGK